MISVQKVDTLEGFDALRADWDRLLAASDFRTIFQTFDWLRTWWNVFGNDKELYILVVRSGDEITGIAPLMAVQSRGWGRRKRILQFLGTPNADYADVIGKDKKEILRAVVDYLVWNRKEWNRIELAQISEKSSTLNIIRTVLKSGNLPSNVTGIESCFSYVYEGEAEYRHGFKIRKGQTVKRSLNYFNKHGGLVLERITEVSEIQKRLAMLYHFHIRRWEVTPTPSKFLDDRNREFYDLLVRTLGPKGRICFLYLRAGSIPLACAFYYQFEKSIYHYTLAFNEYFGKRSPGGLMLILGSEFLVRQGFDLDYSRGAADYKQFRANRTSTNYQATVYGSAGAYVSAGIKRAIKKIGLIRAALGSRHVRGIRARAEAIGQQAGPVRMWLAIAGRLARKIVDRRVFCIYRHAGEPEEVPPPGIDVEEKILGANEIHLIGMFYGISEGSEKYDTFKRRFEKNAECFALLHEGNIAYIGWALFHDDLFLDYDLTVKPKDNEVVFSDVMVLPLYRGLGLYAFALGSMLNMHLKRGFKALLAVESTNIAARKVVEKFKFEMSERHRRIRLFSRWVM